MAPPPRERPRHSLHSGLGARMGAEDEALGHSLLLWPGPGSPAQSVHGRQWARAPAPSCARVSAVWCADPPLCPQGGEPCLTGTQCTGNSSDSPRALHWWFFQLTQADDGGQCTHCPRPSPVGGAALDPGWGRRGAPAPPGGQGCLPESLKTVSAEGLWDRCAVFTAGGTWQTPPQLSDLACGPPRPLQASAALAPRPFVRGPAPPSSPNRKASSVLPRVASAQPFPAHVAPAGLQVRLVLAVGVP